jgi:signal transduction histidine kinase
MIDGVPGRVNAEQRQCLSDVLESSQHLLSLINEVLDLSKIESARTKLKREKVALVELLASLTRSMMPILRPREQSLSAEIEDGLPPVYADKGRLGQVLRNLVANSSKFTPAGGELKIKVTGDDGWCRLSVIDNGIGIKKEDQERIFEPFCQLDYAPGESRAGTGLGLAVVRQIVEKHGGEVWVESEYGEGSRFTFTMPLATRDTPSKEGDKS